MGVCPSDTQDDMSLQKSWEVKAAKKADDLLESYMGIRDMELGECVVMEDVTP